MLLLHVYIQCYIYVYSIFSSEYLSVDMIFRWQDRYSFFSFGIRCCRFSYGLWIYDVEGWKKSDGFPMIFICDLTTSYFWQSFTNLCFLILIFYDLFYSPFQIGFENWNWNVDCEPVMLENICYSWWEYPFDDSYPPRSLRLPVIFIF